MGKADAALLGTWHLKKRGATTVTQARRRDGLASDRMKRNALRQRKPAARRPESPANSTTLSTMNDQIARSGVASYVNQSAAAVGGAV